MDLSNELISQFAKLTNNNGKNKSSETTVYATTVEYDGQMYVKIDGSEQLTPVETTTEIQNDQRVTVMLKNHNATVTGNISSPSVGTQTVKDLEKELTSSIEQTESSILSTVSATYATQEGLNEYKSTAEQTANKLEWIVSGGDSSSTMTLTNDFYSVVSNNINLTADNIALEGYTTINGGFSVDESGNMTAKGATFNGVINNNDNFMVATSGNLKVGGLSGRTIDGYERGQFEVTSNGTIYSVAGPTVGNDIYTKITEGKIVLNSGVDNMKTTIDPVSGIQTDFPIGTNSIGNNSGNQIEITGGDLCTVLARSTSDAGYFHPSDDGLTRLGTASHYWNIVYATGGVNTGSDRTIKENIDYISNVNSVTLDDLYNFIVNDYALATYNYISDKAKHKKVSAIAQDLLVNDDGSDNLVGQLVVDCVEAAKEQTSLSMNQVQLLNVTIGALQKACQRIDELEQRIKKLEG